MASPMYVTCKYFLIRVTEEYLGAISKKLAAFSGFKSKIENSKQRLADESYLCEITIKTRHCDRLTYHL